MITIGLHYCKFSVLSKEIPQRILSTRPRVSWFATNLLAAVLKANALDVNVVECGLYFFYAI